MKKLINSKLFLFLVVATFVFSSLAVSGVAHAQVEHISFAGSNPGGLMYYLVGVAGDIFTRESDIYNVTQVSTGGSTENTLRLMDGSADMGISYDAHMFLGIQGEEAPFDQGGGENINVMAKIYDGMSKIVVRADSDIQEMEDLRGKTVALGPPGSGTVWNARNILDALGILEDVDVEMLSFDDAGRAVQDGHIDAFSQSSAPAASVTELNETVGARVISLTQEEMDMVSEKYPFYYGDYMSGDYYPGIDEAFVPHFDVSWGVNADVSEDAVYEILSLAYKHHDELVDGNVAWSGLTPSVQVFIDLGIPIHPGAERYYREQGVWPE